MLEIQAETITFTEDGEQKAVTVPLQDLPSNAIRIDFDGTVYKCYFVGE